MMANNILNHILKKNLKAMKNKPNRILLEPKKSTIIIKKDITADITNIGHIVDMDIDIIIIDVGQEN